MGNQRSGIPTKEISLRRRYASNSVALSPNITNPAITANSGNTNSFNTTNNYYGGANSSPNHVEILQCPHTSQYEEHRDRVRQPVEGTCTCLVVSSAVAKAAECVSTAFLRAVEIAVITSWASGWIAFAIVLFLGFLVWATGAVRESTATATEYFRSVAFAAFRFAFESGCDSLFFGFVVRFVVEFVGALFT